MLLNVRGQHGLSVVLHNLKYGVRAQWPTEQRGGVML